MDNKQLFENAKVKAPDDFAKNTMKYIRLKEAEEQEKSTAKIQYSFFKLGQICVAASLLLVIINIFPAEEIVHGQDNVNTNEQQQNIIQKAFSAADEFIDTTIEQINFEIFKIEKGEKDE